MKKSNQNPERSFFWGTILAMFTSQIDQEIKNNKASLNEEMKKTAKLLEEWDAQSLEVQKSLDRTDRIISGNFNS